MPDLPKQLDLRLPEQEETVLSAKDIDEFREQVARYRRLYVGAAPRQHAQVRAEDLANMINAPRYEFNRINLPPVPEFAAPDPVLVPQFMEINIGAARPRRPIDAWCERVNRLLDGPNDPNN